MMDGMMIINKHLQILYGDGPTPVHVFCFVRSFYLVDSYYYYYYYYHTLYD